MCQLVVTITCWIHQGKHLLSPQSTVAISKMYGEAVGSTGASVLLLLQFLVVQSVCSEKSNVDPKLGVDTQFLQICDRYFSISQRLLFDRFTVASG